MKQREMSGKMEMRGRLVWEEILRLLLAKEIGLTKVLLIFEDQELSPGTNMLI